VQKKFPEDMPKAWVDHSKLPTEEATELLQKMGVKGWTGTEESLRRLKPVFRRLEAGEEVGGWSRRYCCLLEARLVGESTNDLYSLPAS